MTTVKLAADEVRREMKVRDTVYPRLIEHGKLSQGEADRRRRALLWAIQWLDYLHDKWEGGTPTPPETVDRVTHRHD